MFINDDINVNYYIKVIYETPPIGKEQIILELTTFDIDKYNKDKELQKIKKMQKINIDNLEITTLDGSYEDRTAEIIKIITNNALTEEHKNLMEIIEKQQEYISYLITHNTTVKLFNNIDDINKNIDMW